jgi:2'-5' RNA ligase
MTSSSTITTNTTTTTTTNNPRKYHHMTVCLVPPESATLVWERVTQLRVDLRDPGLYRWPPHANLLYPFVDPFFFNDAQEEGLQQQQQTKQMLINTTIMDRLQTACQQIQPFTVRLNQFGTFGGAKRGVLWLHPDSNEQSDINTTSTSCREPLVELQEQLQRQFPFCSEQQKGGSFSPHMTLSHLPNLQQATERIPKDWEPLEFKVDCIYLLYRQGDDGQFLRVADIPLGTSSNSSDQQQYLVHNPPKRFCHMPLQEDDWVRQERMKLKARRNNNNNNGNTRTGNSSGNSNNRRQGSKSGQRTPSTDSPEIIAAKRAARKAKKEATRIVVREGDEWDDNILTLSDL